MHSKTIQVCILSMPLCCYLAENRRWNTIFISKYLFQNFISFVFYSTLVFPFSLISKTFFFLDCLGIESKTTILSYVFRKVSFNQRIFFGRSMSLFSILNLKECNEEIFHCFIYFQFWRWGFQFASSNYFLFQRNGYFKLCIVQLLHLILIFIMYKMFHFIIVE